jgi:hypothetical protein
LLGHKLTKNNKQILTNSTGNIRQARVVRQVR